MRYVLLLLTLLTAGFSVWYYQNRISPEGKELAAQKTTLEQEANPETDPMTVEQNI